MIYVASLVVGLIVGGVYGLIGLRSPAPPVAALIGLLGMLAGENGVGIAKRALAQRGHAPAVATETVKPRVNGAN